MNLRVLLTFFLKKKKKIKIIFLEQLTMKYTKHKKNQLHVFLFKKINIV